MQRLLASTTAYRQLASTAHAPACRRLVTIAPPRLPPRHFLHWIARNGRVPDTNARSRDRAWCAASSQSRPATPADSDCVYGCAPCRQPLRRPPPWSAQSARASCKTIDTLRKASCEPMRVQFPRHPWTLYSSPRARRSNQTLPEGAGRVLRCPAVPSTQSTSLRWPLARPLESPPTLWARLLQRDCPSRSLACWGTCLCRVARQK